MTSRPELKKAHPTASIIIPAFNEEGSIPQLLTQLDLLVSRNPQVRFQVVIVENGSVDDSLNLLRDAVGQRAWLQIVSLTRNFDIEGAMLAGLDLIDGDCCIFLNADLEDPPELIDQFLDEWRRGAIHVVGYVRERPNYSRFRNFMTRIFYSVADQVTAGAIAQNISDFRLVDKLLYEQLREMREFSRLNRGLIGYLGGPVVTIPFERRPRAGGESSFKIWSAVKWGFRHILGFTVAPLRMITSLGVLCCALAVLGIAYFATRAFTAGVPFPGFGSLMLVMLVIGGLQFIALGVIAEYLAIVFLELKGRPRYVVREKFGTDQDS